MEEGQRLRGQRIAEKKYKEVLILVVMEEGQRPTDRLYRRAFKPGRLNPCCNGRGSKTNTFIPPHEVINRVLILVVMEEGQRQYDVVKQVIAGCLNPCCNGRGSKTCRSACCRLLRS